MNLKVRGIKEKTGKMDTEKKSRTQKKNEDRGLGDFICESMAMKRIKEIIIMLSSALFIFRVLYLSSFHFLLSSF